MILETGDVILTARNSIIVRFMSLFQDDPVVWGHVLIVKDAYTAWEAGWRLREVDIDKRLSKLGEKNYKIIRKRDLTADQKVLIRKEAEKLLGLPYGVWRIVLQMFDQIFHTNWFTSKEEDEHIQVCSSYAAWIYYNACEYCFNGCEWESCDPDDIEDDQLAYPERWEVLADRGM